jgi:hypothetical protein
MTLPLRISDAEADLDAWAQLRIGGLECRASQVAEAHAA